jgi:DNA sulfur modification protein DndC
MNEDLIIDALVARGALFAVNHSAGKDSQAMMHLVRQRVPAEQIVVIHADLGPVEWSGVLDHIKNNIDDLPLLVCKNERRDLLQMIDDRGMFPSPQQRQCTSDLKRGPIERTIRRHLKAHPEFGGLVVNCMGMRAEESPGRSKLKSFKLHEGNSVAGREWYDWLPIQDMKIDQVWETIADAGQVPHFAYALGMSRLSCCFCIMSSVKDLIVAANNNQALYATYCYLELKTGRSMMMPKGGVPMMLPQITGIEPDFSLLTLDADPEIVGRHMALAA